MSLLQVEHLFKSFGSVKVLKDINFSLERGEVLCILGSSGGGKTTLLRCINFLETATAGRILLDGEPVFDALKPQKSDSKLRDARLRIGLVFQQFNLFPQYSVLDNVTLAPRLLNRGTRAELEANARLLLDQMELSDKYDFYPSQLSGGQQQRVAIARALALNPEILCFDEPTSALDPALKNEVVNVIRGLREKNTTMLIVTHDMDFARSVADRVIFVSKGRIDEDADADSFFSRPKSDAARNFLQMGGY